MRAIIPSLLRDWRIALMLIGAACVTPDRAAAGCGDHVTILNGSSTSDHHAAAPASPAQPMKLPCQGPNCSGDPVHSQTPFAPAVPPAPQGKEIAQAHNGVGCDAGARSHLNHDSSAGHPIRRATSIFHPPRIG